MCDTILELKESDLKVKYVPYSEDDSRALVQNRIGSYKKPKSKFNLNTNILLEHLQMLIGLEEEFGIDLNKMRKIPLIKPFITEIKQRCLYFG